MLLSLPGPDAVVAVVQEMESSLSNGDILIDLTTSTPGTTEAVANQLCQRDVAVLGAPVSGGPSGAADGTLAVMVGGDPAVFERHHDLFDTIGETIIHVDGRPGHGHAMKLAYNYLSFVAMICTSEVVVLGEQVGLDPETMIELFKVILEQIRLINVEDIDPLVPCPAELRHPVWYSMS